MFDNIAPRYDLVNRLMTFRLDVRWRRRAIRSLGLETMVANTIMRKDEDRVALADAVLGFWGEGAEKRFVVLTGGEPMLQVDDALVDALHVRGFRIRRLRAQSGRAGVLKENLSLMVRVPVPHTPSHHGNAEAGLALVDMREPGPL